MAPTQSKTTSKNKKKAVDFTKHKLGTKWRLPDSEEIYHLRRKTDPKTLEGTHYFWCPSTHIYIYDLTLDWKQA